MEENFVCPSIDECNRRWKLIRKAMKKDDLDCLVIYSSARHHAHLCENANLRYVTNYGINWGGDAYAIFPRDGDPSLLVWLDPSLARFARRISWVKNIELGYPIYAKKIADKVKALGLDKKNIGIVGNDDFCLTPPYPPIYLDLVKELPQAKFKPTFLLQKLRMIKSQEEIDFIEKSAELADIAYETMEKIAKPGVKEYELHAAVEYALLSHRGWHPSFILLSSGPATNTEWVFPHWGGHNRTLKQGDLILNELGPCYGGYFSESARPISIGKPPKVITQMFDVALEVYKIVTRMLKPGVDIEEIGKVAYEPIIKAGFTWEVTPAHGVGLSCAEAPILGLTEIPGVPPMPSIKLEPGMVIVNHPHVTSRDGKAGMLLGDQYIITDSGSRCLNKHPLELKVV